MKNCVLSIDLGSTNFKAAVFDRALQMKGFGSTQLKYVHPGEGAYELEPELIFEVLHDSISKALNSAGLTGKQLSAIAVTGQAQTFTLVDGNKVRNFISWRDSRADAADLNDSAFARDFSRHSCCEKIPGNLQLSMVRHFFSNTAQQILPLHSYVVQQMCDRAFTDENMAAMTGFYSLIKRRWWSQGLELCGLKSRQMPELCGTGTAVAVTTRSAQRFSLPEGIAVILCGNDQTAGALGADIKYNEVYLSLGTAYVAYAVFAQLPVHCGGTIRGIYPGDRYYRLAVASVGGQDLTNAANDLSDGDFQKLFREFKDEKSIKTDFLEQIRNAIFQCSAGAPVNKLIVSGGGSMPEFIELLQEYTRYDVMVADSSTLLGVAKKSWQLIL